VKPYLSVYLVFCKQFNLLSVDPYAIVISLHVSKVSDTVRHTTLLQKFKQSDIPDAVGLAKLLYASSAWWGVTTTDDRHHIQAVVRRGVRAGLYPADGPTAAQLVEDYDNTLFRHLMNFEQHVLYQLLPAQSDNHDYNLRPRHTIFPSPMPWYTVTSYLE